MSTTQKQVVANQQNAQLSTGPITPEGKAISSKNATKHGLYSRDVILNSPHHSESPEEFQQLLESLWDELKPETLFQEHLVRKIANCIWRSRRAVIAETAHINHNLADVEEDVQRDLRFKGVTSESAGEEPDEETQAEIDESLNYSVGRYLVPRRDFSHNVLWYEMRLDRQISRAYALLNHLKKRPEFSESPRDPIHPELAIFEK